MGLSELFRLCQNASLSGTNSSSSQGGTAELEDPDKHALLYIVVVLLFYSTGIVVAIVMYLKREKEEIVEEKAYEDYMNFRADPDKWARYFRVQRMICHLNHVEKLQDERQSKEDKEREDKESRKKSRTKSGKSYGKQISRAESTLSPTSSFHSACDYTIHPGTSAESKVLYLGKPSISRSNSSTLHSPTGTTVIHKEPVPEGTSVTSV